MPAGREGGRERDGFWRTEKEGAPGFGRGRPHPANVTAVQHNLPGLVFVFQECWESAQNISFGLLKIEQSHFGIYQKTDTDTPIHQAPIPDAREKLQDADAQRLQLNPAGLAADQEHLPIGSSPRRLTNTCSGVVPKTRNDRPSQLLAAAVCGLSLHLLDASFILQDSRSYSYRRTIEIQPINPHSSKTQRQAHGVLKGGPSGREGPGLQKAHPHSREVKALPGEKRRQDGSSAEDKRTS